MIYITNTAGRVVRRSGNLRGIVDHAGRFVVRKCVASEGPQGEYMLKVFYDNGDVARAVFADWRVLVDWVRSRRSWDAEFTFPIGWIRRAKDDCN